MTGTDCICGRVVEYEGLEGGSRAVIVMAAPENVLPPPAALLLGLGVGMVLTLLIGWLALVGVVKPWRRGGR